MKTFIAIEDIDLRRQTGNNNLPEIINIGSTLYSAPAQEQDTALLFQKLRLSFSPDGSNSFPVHFWKVAEID